MESTETGGFALEGDQLFELENERTSLAGLAGGPKLRSGVNISHLLQTGSVSFEVDTENDESLDLDDDYDMLSNPAENELLSNSYSNRQTDKKYDVIYKSIDIEESSGQFEHIVEKMESLTPDNKVKKLVVRKGTGVRIPQDGKVWIDYIAFAEFAEGSDDNAFDSTTHRGVPECISLTSHECLEGLEIGLKSMEYNEVAKFWIHYDYGYGKLGVPPRIPPAACLMYTVELKQVLNGEQLKSCLYMTKEERNLLQFEEIYKVSNEMKISGNGFYKIGNQREAIKRYRKGLQLLENYSTIKKDDDSKRNDLVFLLYTNLAQCYLKEANYAKVCVVCKAALQVPKHPPELIDKVYYRFAQAKYKLGAYEDALDLIKKAITKASSKSPEMKEFQAEVEKAIERNSTTMKNMCKNMFTTHISGTN